MMNGFTTEPAAWTERYETLRRYVLEGRSELQTQPLGLALLMAKGMAGWMKQWSRLAQATAPPPSPAARPDGCAPDGWQQQLTLVLAQMTLGYLQPQGSL